MIDSFNRQIDYLRISVTDRCNLRCRYCMGEEGLPLTTHDKILTYDEIVRVAKAAASLGISKIRITGGEPLVRKNVDVLIKQLKHIDGIEDVFLTTNGVLLADQLDKLIEAGVGSINVSLDTINAKAYNFITRRDEHENVIKAIKAAVNKGLLVKINAVLTAYDEQRPEDVLLLAEKLPIHIRYIEQMPLGFGKSENGISSHKMMRRIRNMPQISGRKIKRINAKIGAGSAEYYEIEGFRGYLGFISPMSHTFCGECNRLRLTSEGELKPCLYSNEGIELRAKLRTGCMESELKEMIKTAILTKPKAHKFSEDEAQGVYSMAKIGG